MTKHVTSAESFANKVNFVKRADVETGQESARRTLNTIAKLCQ